MLPILGAIIGPIIKTIGSLGTSWLENRKAKAAGKIAITNAKIAARVKKEEAKANMDLSAMDNMRFSWKDEYLVILLTMPLIACFIPGLADYVAAGFDILKYNTPDWYKWALSGMIAATFGLRTWKGFGK
jgi:hypothetical protein